jgi:hypothetical protein
MRQPMSYAEKVVPMGQRLILTTMLLFFLWIWSEFSRWATVPLLLALLATWLPYRGLIVLSALAFAAIAAIGAYDFGPDILAAAPYALFLLFPCILWFCIVFPFCLRPAAAPSSSPRRAQPRARL